MFGVVSGDFDDGLIEFGVTQHIVLTLIDQRTSATEAMNALTSTELLTSKHAQTPWPNRIGDTNAAPSGTSTGAGSARRLRRRR